MLKNTFGNHILQPRPTQIPPGYWKTTFDGATSDPRKTIQNLEGEKEKPSPTPH